MAAPVIAFVLTQGPVTLDATAIRNAHRRLVPGAAALTIEMSDPGNAVIAPEDSDLAFILATMPAPVPNGEAEDAVRFSISSFGTGWRLPPHDGHIMLVHQARSTLTLDQALTVFTTVVAAVAETVDAVGVYWGPGQATHEPKFFHEIAAHATQGPPVMLWAGVSLARQRGEISLLSRGLPEQVGMPDLLLTAPSAQGNEALGFFFDLLSYMIRRGRAPADGESVGRSAAEKLFVRYVPSPAGDDARVMRVALG